MDKRLGHCLDVPRENSSVRFLLESVLVINVFQRPYHFHPGSQVNGHHFFIILSYCFSNVCEVCSDAPSLLLLVVGAFPFSS